MYNQRPKETEIRNRPQESSYSQLLRATETGLTPSSCEPLGFDNLQKMSANLNYYTYA